MRILFVEDCAEQSDLWLDRLRSSGFAVTLAVSGVDALAAAAIGPFDLVLMDIGLGPGINGIEAAVRLRLRNPGLPLIFMSSHDDWETLEQAKLAFPAGYLFKPFDFQDLLAAIERGTSKAMPDNNSDHDLLVRIDTTLGLIGKQLNEARELLAAKADRESLEPRLVRIEDRLNSVIVKVAAIGGGVIVIEALLSKFGK